MEIKTIYHLANLFKCCIDNKALLSGKILHAYIIHNGLLFDTFLSNRLVEMYSKCGQAIYARNMFDEITQKNTYSWHAMLDCYCKAGNLDRAQELFEEMPERKDVSWNTLISALVRSGFENKALGFYFRMYIEGIAPTRFTLASVLSACGVLADASIGSKCHGISVKFGLDKNIYVGNALLSMYAKCACIDDAIRAFDDLIETNEVSFTAMMGMCLESDRIEEAFNTFRSMHRAGISLDSMSLSSVLAVCARVKIENFRESDNILGRQIHDLTLQLGFQRDLHLSNSLLDMYTKSGDMESAELIFADNPQVNVVSWNIMIGGYGQKNEIHKALKYMDKMLYQGFEPNDVTYINMLTACINSGDIDLGREIFDKIPCPSISLYNAMLSGSQIKNHKIAIELFGKMQLQNVQPDPTTFSIILSACSELGFIQGGKQVHGASYRGMLHSDVYIASGLIGMYSKCNNVLIAKRVFDRIPDRDIVCWNALIAGLSENSLNKEAFNFFKKMLTENMYPTQFSYATALSCCAKLSCLSQGIQLHALISKHGFVNDVFVGSSLIDMYCKCGDVDVARLVFDTMISKNIVTWNEMIHGYAQNGRGYEALNLYNYMIDSGEKPDEITFVNILTACSHSGLVEMGIKIFNSMELDHGVKPLIDHYTCILDALGRAGRFDEAEIILQKMPYRDNSIIWEVVLSSCRVHGNLSLAKKAADELFRLNPHNPAPYVLLANMYSSLGRWEEVKAVREMMNDKNVVKNRGYSRVEYTKGLEVFELDDVEMIVA